MEWLRGRSFLICRIASKNGRPSMSPTVPPISHQNEVVIVVAGQDEILDGIGDVGNDLDGGAEIIAAALLGQDVLIDAAGGDVVLLGRGTPGEALVMTEIEIGLRAVVGHEHFAVLVRRHRSGIEVEVGIELAKADLVAPRLQQRAERRRCQTFSERGDHAAGDENVPRHGTQPLRLQCRFAKTNRSRQPGFGRAVGDFKIQTIAAS